MSIKSERLKKMEKELSDLEKWLELGLVPKKDTKKHLEEIEAIKAKINEEEQRLLYMKENGETEEYTAPKRGVAKQAYAEPNTLPGVDINATDSGLDMENDTFDTETSGNNHKTEDVTIFEEEEEEENPFSDKNRWKRGILEDPENDAW